jgi:hypothetical protein
MLGLTTWSPSTSRLLGPRPTSTLLRHGCRRREVVRGTGGKGHDGQCGIRTSLRRTHAAINDEEVRRSEGAQIGVNHAVSSAPIRQPPIRWASRMMMMASAAPAA